MPDEPYWMNALARFIAWFVKAGRSLVDILDKLRFRFPDLSDAQFSQGYAMAERAVRVGENISLLPPNAPIRQALMGQIPPAERTYINARVAITFADGTVFYRTLQWRGSWDTTRGAIQDELERLATNIFTGVYYHGTPSPFVGATNIDVDLGVPTWWEHPSEIE